jgi:hypothetical protein
MNKQHFHPVGYRDIVILMLLLACFCGTSKAQNIQVESKLDKASMPIGAQTSLHVSAHIPVKSGILFPLLKDSIGKIKIVNGPKADTTVDKNESGRETITHSYTITSFDTGVYLIPALVFHANSVVFKTNKLTLKITAVPVDTTKVFYDIKQPFVVPYTFWDWLRDHRILVVIISAAILLVITMIWYLKKRPKETVINKPAPVLTADAIALNKLYELRDKKLWQQNEIKLYYIELTDILRDYLEKRYHIQAHEQTTDEILSALKDHVIPADARNSLKQLLTLADLVKFAKEQPSPAQNEQSMEDAIDFIRQAKEDLPE